MSLSGITGSVSEGDGSIQNALASDGFISGGVKTEPVLNGGIETMEPNDCRETSVWIKL